MEIRLVGSEEVGAGADSGVDRGSGSAVLLRWLSLLDTACWCTTHLVVVVADSSESVCARSGGGGSDGGCGSAWYSSSLVESGCNVRVLRCDVSGEASVVSMLAVVMCTT